MNKSTHPPLPPNCQFFRKQYFEQCKDGAWKFSVWNSSMEPLDLDFTAPGFNFGSPWRQIISCVARCAWLDEADRLEADFCTDECGVVRKGMLCSDAYMVRHDGKVSLDELLDAWKSAKLAIAGARMASVAWDKWSRGEKWD